MLPGRWIVLAVRCVQRVGLDGGDGDWIRFDTILTYPNNNWWKTLSFKKVYSDTSPLYRGVGGPKNWSKIWFVIFLNFKKLEVGIFFSFRHGKSVIRDHNVSNGICCASCNNHIPTLVLRRLRGINEVSLNFLVHSSRDVFTGLWSLRYCRWP